MNRILIALLLTACGGKSEEAPPSGSAAPAGGSAPAGSATPAAGSATAAKSAGAVGSAGSAAVAAKEWVIPTPEDFEAESATRLTEKNLDTEVKLLEEEIGEE